MCLHVCARARMRVPVCEQDTLKHPIDMQILIMLQEFKRKQET